jgi:hypothetical protein
MDHDKKLLLIGRIVQNKRTKQLSFLLPMKQINAETKINPELKALFNESVYPKKAKAEFFWRLK